MLHQISFKGLHNLVLPAVLYAKHGLSNFSLQIGDTEEFESRLKGLESYADMIKKLEDDLVRCLILFKYEMLT